MKQSTLHKIVLFTVFEYLQKHCKDETVYQRDKLIEVVSKILSYRMFHKFSKEEAESSQELGSRPEFVKLAKQEVDYSLFAIELLNIWVDAIPKKKRPHLNMSDKRIKDLKANLVIDSLKLKQKNTESYERVKAIVDDSRLTAKQFMGLLQKEIV